MAEIYGWDRHSPVAIVLSPGPTGYDLRRLRRHLSETVSGTIFGHVTFETAAPGRSFIADAITSIQSCILNDCVLVSE